MQPLSRGHRRDVLWHILSSAATTTVPAGFRSTGAQTLSRWADDTTSEAWDHASRVAAAAAGARRAEVRFATAVATATRWADSLTAMCHVEAPDGDDPWFDALHRALLAALTLTIVRNGDSNAAAVYTRCRHTAQTKLTAALGEPVNG